MANQPFRVNSISLPIVGANYLETSGPNLIPLPQLIADVKAAGANDAKLIVTAGVASAAADNSYSASLLARYSPSDAKLLDFAAQLRSQGLELTWSPFFQLDGTVAGSSSNAVGDRIRPADFDAWIANHQAALVHQAQLAQQAGATRFVIFSDEVQHLLFETQRTDTARIQKWLNLIQAVRNEFRGEITTTIAVDGTRFGNGVTHLGLIPEQIVAAWDTIGIGLFPDPLTRKLDPTVDELAAAWYANANGFNSIETLRGYAQQFNKKVWISDRAAHSFDGANINHGQILNSQTPLTADPQEQADILDSLLRVLANEKGDWFNGIAIQNMNRFVDYTAGVARFLDSAVGENIQGKPAEAVVAAWYNGLRQGAGKLFEGTAGADRIVAGYLNDQLRGGAGNDDLTGAEGIDTAMYAGNRASFTITSTGSGYTVSDRGGAEGTDTLRQIERIQFADARVALDVDGNGGKAYRLYQAAFNRTPDQGGLGFQMKTLDNGAALSQVAANFIASPEFQRTYGALNDSQFVTQLYQNVLHRGPDAGGLSFHTGNLDRGMSRADVLVGFSESPENQAALIGTIQNGMVYSI